MGLSSHQPSPPLHPGMQVFEGPGGWHVRLIVPASTAHEQRIEFLAGLITKPPLCGPPSKRVRTCELTNEAERRSLRNP